MNAAQVRSSTRRTRIWIPVSVRPATATALGTIIANPRKVKTGLRTSRYGPVVTPARCGRSRRPRSAMRLRAPFGRRTSHERHIPRQPGPRCAQPGGDRRHTGQGSGGRADADHQVAGINGDQPHHSVEPGAARGGRLPVSPVRRLWISVRSPPAGSIITTNRPRAATTITGRPVLCSPGPRVASCGWARSRGEHPLPRRHHEVDACCVHFPVPSQGSLSAVLIRALRVLFSARPRIRAATLPCLSRTRVVGTARGGTWLARASRIPPSESLKLG